jgi:hypothetical protein
MKPTDAARGGAMQAPQGATVDGGSASDESDRDSDD